MRRCGGGATPEEKSLKRDESWPDLEGQQRSEGVFDSCSSFVLCYRSFSFILETRKNTLDNDQVQSNYSVCVMINALGRRAGAQTSEALLFRAMI